MTDLLPTPCASDFMNRRIETAQPNWTLEEVINFLLVQGVSNVPVVEGNRDDPPMLLGFISEQDCLEHLSNELFYGRVEPAQTARTIMKRHPVCIAPDTELFALVSIFVEHRHRHLPVVEEGRLLGIVSRRDILRAIDAYYREAFLKRQCEHFPPDQSMIDNLRFQLSVR